MAATSVIMMGHKCSRWGGDWWLEGWEIQAPRASGVGAGVVRGFEGSYGIVKKGVYPIAVGRASGKTVPEEGVGVKGGLQPW